jgi:hypothetical protein
MYMRAVIYRIVYVGIVSVGILLSAAFRHSTVQAAPVASAAARSTASAAPRIVTLPTVEVRAASVREPTTTAKASSASIVIQVQGDHANDSHAVATPTFRLDMPYYSLGRVLPRVGKE